MNTSSQKLKNIHKSFPEYREVIERLEAVLAEGSKEHSEYTLDRMYELVHADSLTQMAELIAWLVEHRYLEQFIRISSPSGIGLQDIPSYTKRPSFVFDDAETGTKIPVTDENTTILFRVSAA